MALAERMKARGHDVVLIVLLPRQLREFSAGVEIVRIDMTRSPLGLCRGLMRGHKFVREFHPDVLHSHTFPANMVARTLCLTGAAPRVLSTIHNIYEGGWVRTLAYRLSDPWSISTAAVSHALADRYIRIGAVPRDKCSVIANGIDVEAFAPVHGEAAREQQSTREQCGFVWLAAGRAVPAKDFDNLLAAFRIVHAEMPKAQLWIAGEHEAKQSQMIGQGVAFDAVRRLGPCDDMPATIARADAFVLSSAWEGMPLVVGEAMAMEKPVVATDVGGVRELVGDAGVIVPTKTPRALAEAMLRVMRMPEEERRKMGKAARARIVRHFDIDARAREWEALYSELTGIETRSAASHAW